jgi:hypothetical protein
MAFYTIPVERLLQTCFHNLNEQRQQNNQLLHSFTIVTIIPECMSSGQQDMPEKSYNLFRECNLLSLAVLQYDAALDALKLDLLKLIHT